MRQFRSVIFVVLLIAFYPFAAFSQDPFCGTLTSQGKASVRQVPEQMYFHTELIVENEDYTKCSADALDRIDSLRRQFRRKHLDEGLIRTSGFSVSETFSHDRYTGQQVHKGYSTTVQLAIRVRSDDPAAPAIFEMLTSGVRGNVRIDFELTPEQWAASKEKLLRMAVEDATGNAEIIAKSLNVKLGKVVKVQYGNPEVLRNFTSVSYDVRSERIFQVSSVSRPSFNNLTPPEMEMGTSVVLAWEVEY
ncbi:MAG: SIMPL domain-containing protein [Bacteroidota bacterium]